MHLERFASDGQHGPSPAPLSPKDLAQIIGVSESSLKRWIDDGRIPAARTSGGHRRVNVDDAIRFIRGNGYPIRDPRPLGLTVMPPDERPFDQRLYDQLFHGRAIAVRSMLFNAWMGGTSIADLADGPVRAALTRIGELWAHDEHGIAIEHQATDAIIQALASLRTAMGEPTADAPLAIGAAPMRDPYLVPSQLAALALQELGWRVANLGPETPLDAVRSAVQRLQPRLLLISVSTQEALPGLRIQLHKLADEMARLNVNVLVGGRVSTELNLERRPNLLSVRSMTEATAFARGLWQAAPVTMPPQTPASFPAVIG